MRIANDFSEEDSMQSKLKGKSEEEVKKILKDRKQNHAKVMKTEDMWRSQIDDVDHYTSYLDSLDLERSNPSEYFEKKKRKKNSNLEVLITILIIIAVTGVLIYTKYYK